MISFYRQPIIRRSEFYHPFFNNYFYDPFEEIEEIIEPRVVFVKRSSNVPKKQENKKEKKPSLEVPKKMVENLEKAKKENVNKENQEPQEQQSNLDIPHKVIENLEKEKKEVSENQEPKQEEKSKKQVFKFTDFQLKGSLKENEENFSFNGTVPSEISKEDLFIEVKDRDHQHVLIIRGEKKDENGTRSFKRQFLLDRPVNIESIKAKLNENHELSIEIPKVKQNVKRILIE